MKRNHLLLAAAALAFAACSSETDNWNGEIRLRSGLDVQQTTRAATDIQSTQFDKNEQIDVYITEATTGEATTTYAQPLTYTTGESGAMTPSTQPYFPTSGNGVNIFAVYPTGTSIAANNTFTIKDNQSSDANYKASDLMYGAPTGNQSVSRTKSAVVLTFKHLLSKVTVILQPGTGSPDLDGAVVKLKSVKPSTTLTASNASGSISDASGTQTDITVMTAATSALSGSAVIVPQELATTFIEVTLKNGGVLTSNSLTDSSNNALNKVVLESGKAYTYTIKVNLTSLDVTSTISNWGAGGSVEGNAEMSTTD